MTGSFTGRHMTAILVAFFGVVIAVNITMATLASSTFGGTVVDNSYVASQHYNKWLAAARAQDRLGWQTGLSLGADRHPVLRVDAGDGRTGFIADGTAHHPLGRAPDVPLTFAPGMDGQLVATSALPPGRWNVRVTISRAGQSKRLIETLS